VPRRPSRIRSPPIVVILLERPPPQPVSAPLAPAAARVDTPIRSNRPRPPTQSLTPLPLEPSSPSPSVDWYHEAELEGLRHARATPHGTRAAASATASLACKTRPQAHWEPEPKRVGLADGFVPYVRIGPCAVGLAVFGCAFGRSPANGHVLDDARDHDSDALDGPNCAP